MYYSAKLALELLIFGYINKFSLKLDANERILYMLFSFI